MRKSPPRQYMEGPDDMPLVQIGAITADGVHTLGVSRARYLARQLRATLDAIAKLDRSEDVPDLDEIHERFALAADTRAAINKELQSINDAIDRLELGRKREMKGVKDAIDKLLGNTPKRRTVDQPKDITDPDGPFTVGQIATYLRCTVKTVRTKLREHPEIKHVDTIGPKDARRYAKVDVDRLRR